MLGLHRTLLPCNWWFLSVSLWKSSQSQLLVKSEPEFCHKVQVVCCPQFCMWVSEGVAWELQLGGLQFIDQHLLPVANLIHVVTGEKSFLGSCFLAECDEAGSLMESCMCHHGGRFPHHHPPQAASPLGWPSPPLGWPPPLSRPYIGTWQYQVIKWWRVEGARPLRWQSVLVREGVGSQTKALVEPQMV